jgi:16S rRNA (guanine527-N7)-methyltransferase
VIYDERVDSAAITGLLRPYAELNPRQLEQTITYLGLLLKWNAKVNLTSVRDAEQIVTRHFGESFFAGRQLVAVDAATSVIDLGSGAGFPGLPIAVLRPFAGVTLIESSAKKATFLNEVIYALGLKNVKVARQRGESFVGSADLVIMRAVEKFEAAIPIALNLVRPGGCLALMIGASQTSFAMRVAHELTWAKTAAVPGSHSRVILEGIKADTNQPR